MSRREALSLLAAGAGGSVVAFPHAGAAGQTLRDGAVIRTLAGDLAPDDLPDGAILFHEHLSVRWGRPQHFTDDVALIAEEVKAAGQEGIACIVDASHPDVGRRIDALKSIADRSGVPIVAAGGYYTQRLYPADLAAKSMETLADELVEEAASQGLGAFGEIGQHGGEMTPDERKVFQAVGRAHVRTGIPILTHNAYFGDRPEAQSVPRDAALRQLDLLESMGVSPERVALGHMCCLSDPKAEVAQQIARRGAFVGFDRVTIEIVPDAEKVKAAVALIDAGYAAHLLLSSDFAVAASLKANGGPGYAQTVTVFAPMLRAAGVPEATLRQILIDNPRRFLAFVPRSQVDVAGGPFRLRRGRRNAHGEPNCTTEDGTDTEIADWGRRGWVQEQALRLTLTKGKHG